MKLLKNVTKTRKKALNDKVTNISKDNIKKKLNSKSIKIKDKRKIVSVKSKNNLTEGNEVILNNTKNEKIKRKSIPEVKNEKIKIESIPKMKNNIKKRKSLPEVKNEIKKRKSLPEMKNEIKKRKSLPEMKNNIKKRKSLAEMKNNIKKRKSLPEIKNEIERRKSLPEVENEKKKRKKSLPEVKNEKKKRKSLPEVKKVKKLKLDSTVVKPKAIIIEDITTVKKLYPLKLKKKLAKSEIKENGDDIDIEDLSSEHIEECISAIFHLTEEQLKNENALFNVDYQPLFMQVTCIRIPKVPRRQVRMILPNSIASSEDDIALIVCDLEKGRRKDYEPTVNHYKELLEKCGCNQIKDIIPLNQLKTEYDQYELKRKLLNSYDRFLIDGRIAGHVSHLLGKLFYNKRKLPTSVRFSTKDLKSEINNALRKTSMRLNSLADTHIIEVANTSMEKKQILDNVIAACNHLIKVYPGGWSNIRAIRLKTPTGLGFPIYMTLKNKNTVNIPVVKPKRPKAYRNVEGELTTLSSNVNVVVTPEGDVTVKKVISKKSGDKKRNSTEKKEKKEKNKDKNKEEDKVKEEEKKEEEVKEEEKEEEEVKEEEVKVEEKKEEEKKEEEVKEEEEEEDEEEDEEEVKEEKEEKEDEEEVKEEEEDKEDDEDEEEEESIQKK